MCESKQFEEVNELGRTVRRCATCTGLRWTQEGSEYAQCVKKCPKTAQFVENDTVCVSVCTSGFFEIVNGVKICKTSCEHFRTPSEGGYECVSECVAPLDYHVHGECVLKCPLTSPF